MLNPAQITILRELTRTDACDTYYKITDATAVLIRFIHNEESRLRRLDAEEQIDAFFDGLHRYKFPSSLILEDAMELCYVAGFDFVVPDIEISLHDTRSDALRQLARVECNLEVRKSSNVHVTAVIQRVSSGHRHGDNLLAVLLAELAVALERLGVEQIRQAPLIFCESADRMWERCCTLGLLPIQGFSGAWWCDLRSHTPLPSRVSSQISTEDIIAKAQSQV